MLCKKRDQSATGHSSSTMARDANDLSLLHPSSSWRPFWCGAIASTSSALDASSSTQISPTPEVRIPIYPLQCTVYKLRILMDGITRLFGTESADLFVIKSAAENFSDKLKVIDRSGSVFEIYARIDHAEDDENHPSPAYCVVHAGKVELQVVALSDKFADGLIDELRKVLLQGTNDWTDVRVEDKKSLGQYICANLPAKFRFQDLRLLNIQKKTISAALHNKNGRECVEMNIQELCSLRKWGKDLIAQRANQRSGMKTILTVYMDGRLEMQLDGHEDEALFMAMLDYVLPVLMSKSLKPIAPSVIVPNSKTAQVVAELTEGMIAKMRATMNLPVASTSGSDKSLSKPPATIPSAAAVTAGMPPNSVDAASPACVAKPTGVNKLRELPASIEEIRILANDYTSADRTRATPASRQKKVIQEIDAQTNIRQKKMVPVLKSRLLREKSPSSEAESNHASTSRRSACRRTGGMGGRPPGLMATRRFDKSVAEQCSSRARTQESPSSSRASRAESVDSSSPLEHQNRGGTSAAKTTTNARDQQDSVSRQASVNGRRRVNEVSVPPSRANTALPASSLLNSPESSPPSTIMHDHDANRKAKSKKQLPVATGATESTTAANVAHLHELFGDDDSDDGNHSTAKTVSKTASTVSAAAKPTTVSHEVSGGDDFAFMEDDAEADPTPSMPASQNGTAATKSTDADAKRQRNDSPSSRAVGGEAVPVKHAMAAPAARAVSQAQKKTIIDVDNDDSMSTTASTIKSSTRSQKSTQRSQPSSAAKQNNKRKRTVNYESGDDDEDVQVVEKPKSRNSIASSKKSAASSRVKATTTNNRNMVKNMKFAPFVMSVPTFDPSVEFPEPEKDEDKTIADKYEFCFADNEKRFELHMRRTIRFLRSRKHPNPPKRPHAEQLNNKNDAEFARPSHRDFKKRRSNRERTKSQESVDADVDAADNTGNVVGDGDDEPIAPS